MTGETSSKRQFRIGFQTSIITVFVGVVLLVGLTLVYLSFERVTSITIPQPPASLIFLGTHVS